MLASRTCMSPLLSLTLTFSLSYVSWNLHTYTATSKVFSDTDNGSGSTTGAHSNYTCHLTSKVGETFFPSRSLSLTHSRSLTYFFFRFPRRYFSYTSYCKHTLTDHTISEKNERVVFEVIFETEHTFTCTTENTTVIVIIVQCKETAANNNKWVLCIEREYGYIDAERLTKWSQTIIVYYCHTNL